MKADRWQRIDEIFGAALEIADDERAAYLTRACVGDEVLRGEVEALLDAHRCAGDFLQAPAFEDGVELLKRDETGIADGGRIGPYEILREIGRGGMGAVYLATRADDQYQKRVAIKLIKRGMDTDDILRRFRNERQILASLDHPNIARLLDGDTTPDGLPYVVMEYVEGLALMDYCDSRRLSTVERLKLFRRVCSAVQHAHQNLVVHRDLKPSNIIVTAEGEPKLLDFGIAKFLNPEMWPETIVPTATLTRMMTRDYASPEQVRGQPITVASDIYSLGVILYKLLTGHHPYRFDSLLPGDVERVICETEPQRPSDAVKRIEEVATAGGKTMRLTPEAVSRIRDAEPERLRRMLSGDLDTITLMALRKEPARRYSTVEQFSEDIRRYLENLPVLARKDTFVYRASKFMRRRKASVAAATLVALAILGGVVATLWQARIASAQRARAEQRFNDVRRLASSLLFEIHDSVQNLAGSTPTRQLLVTRGLEYLDSLARESGDDPSLQRELATAYEKVGDIQGNPYTENLGDTEGALASYSKALAIRESLSRTGDSPELRQEMALSYRSMGDILEQKGDVAGCVDSYRKSLDLFERLSADDPADTNVRAELARAYEALGDGLSRTTDVAAQIQCYRKALELRDAMLDQDPANDKLRFSVAVSLMKVGDGWQYDKVGGLDGYHRSISLLEQLAAADPNNARARRVLAMAQFRYGEALSAMGDYRGALDILHQSLAVREELVAADAKNMQARFDLASVRTDIAEALSKSGRAEKGEDTGREALSEFQSLVSVDPANMVYRRNLGLCYGVLALAHASLASDTKRPPTLRAQEWSAARALYRQALDVFSDLQDRGALRPTDGNRIGTLTASITQCDEALDKLQR